MSRSISVIGAGAGAICWAAYFSEHGYSVHIGARSKDALSEIGKRKSIKLITDDNISEYPIHGVGDPIDVSKKSEVIVLCVPADHLPAYKEILGKVLTSGQLLILAPGGVGGALYFGQQDGYKPCYDLIELNTLPFIARKKDLTTVQRMVVLKEIFWSSLPAKNNINLKNIVTNLIPTATMVPSVLQTSLTNFNSIIHPVAMIMNAGRIESLGAFYWYRDGSTPAVGRLMDAIDHERILLQKSLGLPQISFNEYFDIAGYSPDVTSYGSIGRTLSTSKPNSNILSPDSLNHRFISEDVPFGLVPLEAISEVCGINSKVIGSVINLCDTAVGKKYRDLGLNADCLGIRGMSVRQIQSAVQNGI